MQMPTFAWLREHGENIRVHGNGFLQLDLPSQNRLHIFSHPDLPAQRVSTHIHDHRFAFRSRILRGRLANICYRMVPSRYPTHRIYTTKPRIGEDTELVDTGIVGELVAIMADIHLAGENYPMPPKVFHETMTNELTVTLIEKYNPIEHEPRILAPIGIKPDNDFTRYDVDPLTLWAIVKDAVDLRGLPG